MRTRSDIWMRDGVLIPFSAFIVSVGFTMTTRKILREMYSSIAKRIYLVAAS